MSSGPINTTTVVYSAINREYTSGEETIPFNSTGKLPFHKLSNFNYIENGIEFEGLVYPSTEHAYQSLKYIESDRYRFSVDGDLGKMSGFSLVFDENKVDVEKKIKYWMKKQNIGVIAKMATDKKRSLKIGLTRNMDFDPSDELWIRILLLKYTIEPYKSILISTENKYLLEFSRSAKFQYDKTGVHTFWAGLLSDNKLYGNNKMGKYIMEIRRIIQDL